MKLLAEKFAAQNQYVHNKLRVRQYDVFSRHVKRQKRSSSLISTDFLLVVPVTAAQAKTTSVTLSLPMIIMFSNFRSPTIVLFTINAMP